MFGSGINIQRRAFSVAGKAAVMLTLALGVGSLVVLVVMGALAVWQ